MDQEWADFAKFGLKKAVKSRQKLRDLRLPDVHIRMSLCTSTRTRVKIHVRVRVRVLRKSKMNLRVYGTRVNTRTCMINHEFLVRNMHFLLIFKSF